MLEIAWIGSLPQELVTSSDAHWCACKAPDAVLTLTSRFRVRSELEAHQTPPAHDTRTRVAAGFSTTGIKTQLYKKGNTYGDNRAGHTTPLSKIHNILLNTSHQYIKRKQDMD